jgi:hypothetical protein
MDINISVEPKRSNSLNINFTESLYIIFYLHNTYPGDDKLDLFNRLFNRLLL